MTPTLTSSRSRRKWSKLVVTEMKAWFEIKVRAILGPQDKDDKEVVILGRVVRWTDKGIEYEADPKHRRLILEHFGISSL